MVPENHLQQLAQRKQRTFSRWEVFMLSLSACPGCRLTSALLDGWTSTLWESFEHSHKYQGNYRNENKEIFMCQKNNSFSCCFISSVASEVLVVLLTCNVKSSLLIEQACEKQPPAAVATGSGLVPSYSPHLDHSWLPLQHALLAWEAPPEFGLSKYLLDSRLL